MHLAIPREFFSAAVLECAKYMSGVQPGSPVVLATPSASSLLHAAFPLSLLDHKTNKKKHLILIFFLLIGLTSTFFSPPLLHCVVWRHMYVFFPSSSGVLCANFALIKQIIGLKPPRICFNYFSFGGAVRKSKAFCIVPGDSFPGRLNSSPSGGETIKTCTMMSSQ